jgi:phosphatidylinositol alpha-mannosyltransferase
MKIALVSPYDYAHPGGVVNHIRSLAEQYIRLGHEVRVIAPSSNKAENTEEEFVCMGRARTIPVPGTVLRISLSVHLAPHIKEVLAREKFDVVHLHEPFMPMLCSAVLRFSNGVNVGTFHACAGKPGYAFGRPLSSFLLKRRNRKLCGRIAVSHAASRYASKSVPGDFTVIPNGVDLKVFHPGVTPIPEYQDGKLNIVFVGRLESRKGVNYLLAAYAKLKAECPDIRLLIVGPGVRLRHRYEKYVRENNLKDVVFVGSVPFSELPRYYQTADIFCSPATGQESFGIVLLEAMALGKPIVATDIEGYSAVVTHGHDGLLVPPRHTGALAEALKKLIQDEGLRRELGNHGLVSVRRYDWSIVAAQLLAYYQLKIEEKYARQGFTLQYPGQVLVQ